MINGMSSACGVQRVLMAMLSDAMNQELPVQVACRLLCVGG